MDIIRVLNLRTMKQTAVDLYDWTRDNYPDSEIVIIGHSYGAGMAAYLASVRECRTLIIAAGYRDISDLYNKIIPVFWGPMKVFISNNIRTAEYAADVGCPVYIIGSTGDRVLGYTLQEKLATGFKNVQVKIFDDIAHEDYFISDDVIDYISRVIG